MNRDREAIARIIEPEAWRNTLGATWRMESLAKADLIAALPVGGGVEDLAQALQDFADEREPQIFLMPNECEAIVEWFAALSPRSADGLGEK